MHKVMLCVYNCFLYEIKCYVLPHVKSQPEYHIYFQNQYTSRVIFVVSNTDIKIAMSNLRSELQLTSSAHLIYIFLNKISLQTLTQFLFYLFFSSIDGIKLSHYWAKSCWDFEFSHWFHICHKRHFLVSKVFWLKFLIYDNISARCECILNHPWRYRTTVSVTTFKAFIQNVLSHVPG